jgi:hypothetical protein
MVNEVRASAKMRKRKRSWHNDVIIKKHPMIHSR